MAAPHSNRRAPAVPHSRAPLGPLVALALALGACGSEESAALPTRIELRAEGALASETAEVVRRWDVGPELPAEWSVHADQHALEPHPDAVDEGDERHMLAMKSTGNSNVRIRGPLHPQTFNQVVATLEILSSRDTLDVGLRGLRKGNKIFEQVQTIWAEHGTHAVVFDLGLNTGERAAYDSVQVFVRKANRLGLSSVALIQRPIADWLPPSDDPRPVLVGDEARPAGVLSSRRPLSARFRGRAGMRLSFGCGRPDITVRPRESARLEVTLKVHGAEPQEATVAFADPGGWHDVRLPITVDAECELRLELHTAGDEEAFCVVTPPDLSTISEAPPTVVLVTSDTHRADHVGTARGGVEVLTPFLDELAEGGVFFEDCYSSTNITNPSHATLLTGLSPRDTGVRTNLTALSLAADTLAESFRSAGFLTVAATSVGHMRDHQSGFAQGFDRFFAPERHALPAEVAIGRLVEWLPAADGRPLFVWLHVFDVHTPYEPPEEYSSMYYPEGRDPYDGQLPELPDVQRTSWDPELRDNDYNLARYKGEVTYVDDRLREVLSLPRLKDAIVAVTSDHGEAFGQHGIWYSHSSLYPATAKVPLLLAWPGAPAGTRVTEPVRQLDVGRTLLDLAGLDQVAFPGKNLLGDEGASVQRFGLSGYSHSATLQEGRWFLSLHLQKHPLTATKYTFEKHELELFDLETDPDCLANVVGDHPHVARRMRAHLVHWLSAEPERALGQTTASHETARLEELAALGYATDSSEDQEALFDLECDCDYCAAYAD